MRVLFLPEVEDYLLDLIEILYDKEYFGFRESAVEYVDELVDIIELSVHTRSKKQAPEHFAQYGENMFYASFKKNQNTQWYIFFTIHEEDTYLIRYVTNNHVSSQYL